MNGPDVAQARLRDMLEPQEQWNATHAQLLKSVADAQGRLLAAQNETNDRLEDLKVLLAVNRIYARLDEIQALLAPPRRQVERLRTKRIPQRKQRR